MENSFYLKCDKLDDLPAINKENWLFELDLQCKILPLGTTLLQVGCMDATRIIEILKVRPDLKITGLEIEKDFVEMAKENLQKANLVAEIIEGDVTKFTTSRRYDYVTCMNNTLSYIPDTAAALQHMKSVGKIVFISVYGEKFDEKAAQEYFGSLGLRVENADDRTFQVSEFGTIKRFMRDEVVQWGTVIETPLGYWIEVKPN